MCLCLHGHSARLGTSGKRIEADTVSVSFLSICHNLLRKENETGVNVSTIDRFNIFLTRERKGSCGFFVCLFFWGFFVCFFLVLFLCIESTNISAR